jgi:hypothetical protein
MSVSNMINIITDGLVFHFDTKSERSYLGAVTTNLTSETSIGAGSNYNNVGANVTTVLSQTSELYKGVPVWKQTLTPLDASGVSWLSNGNNPGLGVVTGGGGGLANRYTGHSIYFKPTVQMHSSPIFTSYSNIGGWQSSTNYDLQPDGWYRAHVIWYDTVTRSDGKYWAINPLSAIANVPIVIYWAAPFKEDSNRSTFVSPFAQYGNPRSVTGALLDMTGTTTINLTNAAYDNAGNTTFDGTGYFYTSTPVLPLANGTPLTLIAWCKPTNLSGWQTVLGTHASWRQIGFLNSNFYFGGNAGGGNNFISGGSVSNNNWYMLAMVYDGGTTGYGYLNGTLAASGNIGSNGAQNGAQVIGSYHTGGYEKFQGSIQKCMVYNRALTSAEIFQNYNASKYAFGL